MQIYPITPNYSQNYSRSTQNQSIQRPVAFTGVRGDKIVSDLAKFKDVKLEDVMQDLKGTFGLKTDKVEDVIESLLAAVKAGFKKELDSAAELKVTKSSLERAENAAADAKQKAADIQAECSEIIKAKNVELREKDEELKRAQEFAEKFKPISTVKSVSEIGTVMPDEVLKVMDEFANKRSKASQSLADFLFTGKGQEEFLAQMERNNIVRSVFFDRMDAIPAISAKISELRNDYMYPGQYSDQFILEAIKEALKTSPKGDYILSSSVAEQVKKNIMGLIAPLKREDCACDPKTLAEKVDDCIDKMVAFRKDLEIGKQKFFARAEREFITTCTEVNVPGSSELSGYNMEYTNGVKYFTSLNQLAYMAKTNY